LITECFGETNFVHFLTTKHSILLIFYNEKLPIFDFWQLEKLGSAQLRKKIVLKVWKVVQTSAKCL